MFQEEVQNIIIYKGSTDMASHSGGYSRQSLELFNSRTSTYTRSKVAENRLVMQWEFDFFSTVVDNYIDAKQNNREVFFNTTLVDGKVDGTGNPYYKLSMTVDGKTTDLLYFSAEEVYSSRGNSKDRLLTIIGNFFAAFKEGTPEEWKPNENTKIQSDFF